MFWRGTYQKYYNCNRCEKDGSVRIPKGIAPDEANVRCKNCGSRNLFFFGC